MIHNSEKFQFTVLLIAYLVMWAGLTLLPYVTDISSAAGVLQMWTHPMFSPWPGLLLVVFGGTWIAEWTENDAWLLNKSFWPKQIFVWIPIVSVMLVSVFD